jgi:hypothetical protein
MLKRLFNEYEALNDAGKELDQRAEQVLTATVNEFVDRGYSFRDIDMVLHSTVACMLAERTIRYVIDKRRQEREWKKSEQ